VIDGRFLTVLALAGLTALQQLRGSRGIVRLGKAFPQGRLSKKESDYYINGARKAYAEEGAIEIDDDARISILDEADDPDGAYVCGWVWVDKRRKKDYIERAREAYASEGAVEIDDDADLSESEGGAYVQAWFWVYKKEASDG
jgi:hypothetical protein